MPGQRPGECGRRIAGRDACPTQKGRHPPHRDVSASPSLTVPTTLFRIHCICPHCGQTWTQFIPLLPFALKSTPLGCPGPTIYRNLMRQNRALLGPENAVGRLGALPSLPTHFSCIAFDISAAKSFPPIAAHKGPNTAFQPCGGVRDATRPIGCTQALTTADTGPCFWFGARFTTIGKDNPVRKVSVSFLVFRHFWEPSVLL